MKRALSSLFIIATLCGFTACQTPPTPQALAYVTIREASNLIDAKMAVFEIKVNEGSVPAIKEIEVRQAYIDANKALRNAALLASADLSVATPEDVRKVVDAFLALVVQVIPPPEK